MAGRAITAIRRAIGLEPGNHTHWNALGVFSMALMDCCSDQDRAKDLAKTAQHAFIKSVSLENTADAWANLGVLYLKLGYSKQEKSTTMWSFFLTRSSRW